MHPPLRPLVNALKQMSHRRHVVAWIGLWLVVMAMSWGAIALLLNPNVGDRPALAPADTPIAQESLETTMRPQQSSGNPAFALWSLGIVAIACMAGSVVISAQLKPPTRRG